MSSPPLGRNPHPAGLQTAPTGWCLFHDRTIGAREETPDSCHKVLRSMNGRREAHMRRCTQPCKNQPAEPGAATTIEMGNGNGSNPNRCGSLASDRACGFGGFAPGLPAAGWAGAATARHAPGKSPRQRIAAGASLRMMVCAIRVSQSPGFRPPPQVGRLSLNASTRSGTQIPFQRPRNRGFQADPTLQLEEFDIGRQVCTGLGGALTYLEQGSALKIRHTSSKQGSEASCEAAWLCLALRIFSGEMRKLKACSKAPQLDDPQTACLSLPRRRSLKECGPLMTFKQDAPCANPLQQNTTPWALKKTSP